MIDLNYSFRFDGGKVLQEQMFTKQDWKLFRTKLSGWQEAYMGRLCSEYIELLSGDQVSSEKFWQLDKRIKEDKRKPGIQLQLSRSNMIYNILALIYDGAISAADLEDFSDELKERIDFFLEREKENSMDTEQIN